VVTDEQVRLLMSLIEKEVTLRTAAAKAGMDPKTARKYRDCGKLPSELATPRTWRTREDPFDGVWESEIVPLLEHNAGLQALTLFEWLQREHPGRFADGQLRTLQRRLKQWRGLSGPPKEVYFPQVHQPGRLCQSDFTDMSQLAVTIEGQPFAHRLYHFVLTYSNWETGSVCFSESFESLSDGLQEALWKLGGVPERHQTDRLSSAVQNLDEKKDFTERYKALLRHYGLDGQKIQAGKANENGDVEQSHYRFETAVDQALMLRGSRDFASRKEYESFLEALFAQRNAGRRERFEEELRVLRRLPRRKVESCRRIRVRVRPSSTIRVLNNTYSVASRLIGEHVDLRIRAERVEVWFAQRKVDELPRLAGRGQCRIEYRHVIDWLVRKPGAFANYRYRDDLFPTSRFRMAFDSLDERCEKPAGEYLKILELAAKQGEDRVDQALASAIEQERPITFERIKQRVLSTSSSEVSYEVSIAEVDLKQYDELLRTAEVA